MLVLRGVELKFSFSDFTISITENPALNTVILCNKYTLTFFRRDISPHHTRVSKSIFQLIYYLFIHKDASL